MFKLKKCSCGRYTFKDICPICGKETRSAHPLRFSPEDKYGSYRRKAKLQKEGTIK